MKQKLDYFDLHADTLTELYDRGEDLDRTTCMISRSSINDFGRYAQIFAVFSRHDLSDEACYERFGDVVSGFEQTEDSFCLNANDIKEKLESGKCAGILSIEDARLTSCSENKLVSLYNRGVRIVTPLWSGTTCIGGSFDTSEGLTEGGAQIIKKCLSLGIICDISHASRKSTDEILTIAEGFKSPVIASHSNSFKLCAHPRNLTDLEAERVALSGGIIGVSLVPYHLTESGKASSDDVADHILHFIDVVGEDRVVLGCDFDGISSTPSDVKNQHEIYNLDKAMERRGIASGTREKILFENAYSFFIKNMK